MGLESEPWTINFGDPEEESSENDAPAVAITNLSALIPGTQSEDRFLLVAPFDSQFFADFEFVGANEGASGAAVLLEMARNLVDQPLEYATEIVFLDGDAPFTPGGPPVEGQHLNRGVGRDALAIRVQESGDSEVRMLVYLDRVGDANLQIARDLISHRIYREEFWEAAEDLGHTDAFPPDASFENAGVSYPSLHRLGFRRMVSIVDLVYGPDQESDAYSGSEEDTLDHCSAESLEVVGEVTLAAIHVISQRLTRIDLFTRMPDTVGEPAGELADEPADAPTEEPAEGPADEPAEEAAISWEDDQEEAIGTQDAPSVDAEESTP
jgi:hypothetical protein